MISCGCQNKSKQRLFTGSWLIWLTLFRVYHKMSTFLVVVYLQVFCKAWGYGLLVYFIVICRCLRFLAQMMLTDSLCAVGRQLTPKNRSPASWKRQNNYPKFDRDVTFYYLSAEELRRSQRYREEINGTQSIYHLNTLMQGLGESTAERLHFEVLQFTQFVFHNCNNT